ncbi:MAG: hypothetical protein H7831_16425, partial [Magnetococcus sp. WYHC-3]
MSVSSRLDPPPLGAALHRLDTLALVVHRGFSAIGKSVGLFTNTLAAGASHAVSISHRIRSGGRMGMDPLGQNLKKVYQEIDQVQDAVSTLTATQDSLIGRLDGLTGWCLSLEKETYLP